MSKIREYKGYKIGLTTYSQYKYRIVGSETTDYGADTLKEAYSVINELVDRKVVSLFRGYRW